LFLLSIILRSRPYHRKTDTREKYKIITSGENYHGRGAGEDKKKYSLSFFLVVVLVNIHIQLIKMNTIRGNPPRGNRIQSPLLSIVGRTSNRTRYFDIL